MYKLTTLVISVLLAALHTACSSEIANPCDGLITISGTDENDRLVGGEESECLIGGGGRDVMSGEGGNDVLIGGADIDIMSGGAGDDFFVIGLGDGMDLVAGDGGTDTIIFSPDISISMLSVREDDGVISIQIEQGELWSYVTFGTDYSGETTELVRFANSESLAVAELFARVDNVALGLVDFQRKLVQAATVEVTGTDTDESLFQATAKTIRISNSTKLCAEPSPYPRPDLNVDGKGFGPERGSMAGFYGSAKDDKAKTQRKQFAALALAGLFKEEAITSPAGESGVRYRLTWDGWALQSRKRCFHYGYRKLHEVISYRPIGKTIQGMEAFQVTAKTGVSDVELWAKQPNITDAFPDIVTELSGKTFKVIVLKKDDAWYATLSNGNPAQGVASAPKWRSVPKLRDLLAVEERMFFGTIGEGTVCTVFPMLGAAKTDTRGASYLTYTRYPFAENPNRPYRLADKAYWDMLVGFGVATQHDRHETDKRGNPVRYLEYRVTSAYTVRNPNRSACLEIGETRFEVLHARRSHQNTIVLLGRRVATSPYDWVKSPPFLREHPQLEQMFGDGLPVKYMVTDREDQPLTFSGATGVSRP